MTLKWSESPFSGVHATSYRLQFRNDSRNFKQWTPVPNLGEINRKCHRVVNLTKGMTYQFRVSAGNNGGWGEESEPSDEVCPGSGYGRVAGKMTSSGSIFISTALRRSRLSKGGPLAILDHLELFPMTRDEHVWGLARLRSMAQSASGYKKETLQTRVAVAAIYSLLTFKNDPEMAGVGLSLLGWTLKGPGVGHVMQLVVQNSIIKIAVDYIIRHRTNCDVISAVTLLRCNMPPGCIPRLEDVIVEKNISFPQKNAI